jgi:hypothetical protein
MRLTTRFKIGDRVDVLHTRPDVKRTGCKECSSDGHVYNAYGDKLRSCWHCRGQGYTQQYISSQHWEMTHRSLTVGLVRAEVREADSRGRETKVEYMCQETGVGSGSVFKENGDHCKVVPAGDGDAVAAALNGE